MNKSVATINAPEFLNLQPMDISPLISSCDIKVLYLNENRNGSSISREVAQEMAKSLRGSPIVAAFSEGKQDFLDHGDVITIDSEGVHFSCLTKPYGFVSPDAKVWFQDFEDQDDSGKAVVHTYLMTTGYLWTGAYPEIQAVIDEGRPQSMELNEDTLAGHWAIKGNSDFEFFIIDDAIFEKLCILGDDVEPCFEGANVTAPKTSTNFTMDKNFTNSLYSMMKELKFSLKGGQNMEVEDAVKNEVAEDTLEDNAATGAENFIESSLDSSVQSDDAILQNPTEGENSDNSSFVEQEKEDKNDKNESVEGKEAEAPNEEEDEREKAQKAYELLQSQYTEVVASFNKLKEEFAELVAYRNQLENEKKENLLSEFSLDEKSLQEIKSKLTQFSYEELEAKLSVMESRARRSAATKTEAVENVAPVVTYTIDSCSCDDEITAALKAARNKKQ